MPKIHELEQGSEEWIAVRLGRVTASELGNILTPNFAFRKGETPNTYLCKKVAEAWRGKPLLDDAWSSFASEQGQALEDEARKWFAWEFDEQRIRNVGFVEHDDGKFGCSPDALLGEDSGLELKCPRTKTHVKYLLDGALPDDYATQVHGCMYATGRASWKFVSYARGFPAFVLNVERDEAIIAKIQSALDAFYEQFDSAMATLRELP